MIRSLAFMSKHNLYSTINIILLVQLLRLTINEAVRLGTTFLLASILVNVLNIYVCIYLCICMQELFKN